MVNLRAEGEEETAVEAAVVVEAVPAVAAAAITIIAAGTTKFRDRRLGPNAGGAA